MRRLRRSLLEGEPAARIESRAGSLAALAVAAVIAASAACRKPPESLPTGRLALAELASAARQIVETTEIDVGEAGYRSHLEIGWGADEPSPEGSFAWSGGDAATVRFDVVERRDTVLALRGWSFPFDGDGVQRVEARVNGASIGGFELGREPAVVRLPVPADRLLRGENRLELRPRRRLEREGELPWAVGWERLRFFAGSSARPPGIGSEGALKLPARSALAWTLELPAGSWLAWDGVRARGAARLEIGVRREGEEETAHRFGDAGRLRLTGAAAGLVELTLRALGGDGGVEIVGARLHEPPRPSETPPPSPAIGSPPNLVVYVVDTLRADHLGCYGYERPTSPRLDAFARQSVLWPTARAQSSWTKPAMATLLTGRFPITHGAVRRSLGLAPGIETLGDLLRPAGYESAFFTTNPTVTAKFGFDRGFDDYRYVRRDVGRISRSVRSETIHREAVDWLSRRDPARPFLLVVHTLDPHDPYTPAERFRLRFAPDVDPEVAGHLDEHALALLTPDERAERARQMRALYDAEIAENDESFGALLDELERRGLAASTAVLFTSDHGEEFADHGGWRHASTLYEEVLRIPFVLRLPGGAHAGRVIEAPADQIDVVPTLLAIAGVVPPGELPGGSWLPALSGGAAPERESLAWLAHPSFEIESVVRGGWKRIATRGAWRPPLTRGSDELYHLASDPREVADLTRSRALRRHWLAGRLASAAVRYGSAAAEVEVAIDDELDRSLRALGYL